MRAAKQGALLLAVAIMVAACQQAASVAPSSSQAAARGNISIIFVTTSQPNDPFWSVVKRGAMDAGKDLGVKVQYIGAETFDLTKMVQNMEAAIASKPSGIVVPIYDLSVLGPVIQKAIDAGIPIVEIGSADQPKGSLTTVGSNDLEAGKIAGQRIVDAGATNIICINGEPGNTGLEERCRGMTQGAAPKGKVVEKAIPYTDPALYQQQLTAALKADPTVDAVVTSGPVEATLTMQALKDGGYTDKVKLGTFDLSPEVLKAIDAGTILFALDQQQYQMGYLPVVFITNYVQYLVSPVGRVLTGPGVVTKADAKRIIELSAAGVR
jgi:simple sugar transport system substrate-binding protein